MITLNEAAISLLPLLPGIYLFKNEKGEILYVGKAKILRKRVASYFKKKTDWKISSLLEESSRIDHILTHSEIEALLLEAQLIKEHQPRFNVLLKEGQPFLYILFTQQEPSRIKIVRNKEEKGTYFGPFLFKRHARRAAEYLIRTFRLYLCNKKIEHGCLDYHMGICSGSCKPDFNVTDYSFRIHLALMALKQSHKEFLAMIKNKIQEYNQTFAFEKSKHLHEYLENIEAIFATLKARFSETKYEDAVFAATTPTKTFKKEYATIAAELKNLLQLSHDPIRIDCFDISHFQGKYLVGSCVRFSLGEPDKAHFRKFNIRTLQQQNDYAALQEIVQRRYKDPLEIPDLIVIDGGKGQLSAVKAVLPQAEVISLAKREETVFSDKFPEGLILDVKTGAGQLLIALRDYAHHFAISHHKHRRKKGTYAQ